MKTRSKARIPADLLGLPEGSEVTGANIDGDILEFTFKPEGQTLSGQVHRFRNNGEWAYRIEWITEKDDAEQDTES